MQRRKILTAVIGAAFVAAVPVAGAQTLEGPPPTTPPIVLAQCAGQPATILGGAGADTLDGTPGDDVIVGFGGNDTIRGKGGNDTVAVATATTTSPEAPTTTRCSAKTAVTS